MRLFLWFLNTVQQYVETVEWATFLFYYILQLFCTLSESLFNIYMQMERREVEVFVDEELLFSTLDVILVILVNPAMEVRCKFKVLDLEDFCESFPLPLEICKVLFFDL